MLFRFLIIVSLLLASVEGAPINICRHDLWTNIPAGTRVVSRTRVCIIGQDNCFLHKQCKGPKDYGLDGILPPMIPWNKVNIHYVGFTIIIFLLGIFLGVILRRHLKKDKPRRDDEDKETSDKPIGKHENKLIIGNGEAARGPMAEKSDSLKNTNINKQWIRDNIAKFMTEKSDNLKNSKVNKKWLCEKNTKFEALQKVIINSDRKHENKLINGNGEAARRPMAEKSDSLKNTEINNQQFRDKIAKFKACQKVIIDSDKQQEDEGHIPPPPRVSGIPSQVYVFLPELKTRLSQIRQLGRVRSHCEPTMNMGSSQRRLYISKKRQIPGSVSVLPH